MDVGKVLPVVVLHDEIRFTFLDGPRGREAAGCHNSLVWPVRDYGYGHC